MSTDDLQNFHSLLHTIELPCWIAIAPDATNSYNTAGCFNTSLELSVRKFLKETLVSKPMDWKPLALFPRSPDVTATDFLWDSINDKVYHAEAYWSQERNIPIYSYFWWSDTRRQMIRNWAVSTCGVYNQCGRVLRCLIKTLFSSLSFPINTVYVYISFLWICTIVHIIYEYPVFSKRISGEFKSCIAYQKGTVVFLGYTNKKAV